MGYHILVNSYYLVQDKIMFCISEEKSRED